MEGVVNEVPADLFRMLVICHRLPNPAGSLPRLINELLSTRKVLPPMSMHADRNCKADTLSLRYSA